MEEPWLRVSWPSRGRGSIPTVLLPPKLNWSLDLGGRTPGAFFKQLVAVQQLGGQARPGGLGAGRHTGVLDRVGWVQSLQEAVLCFGQGFLAARTLWLLWVCLGLCLWLFLELQGTVTGDGRGSVDFVQGGAGGRKQVRKELGRAQGDTSSIISELSVY